MFSFRTVLLLVLFALIAFVGSTNGEPGCGSSPSREEMYDEQTQRSAESGDMFNRITLDCQTTGGSSRAHSGSETIIELSIGFFFLIWVVIGIWIVFVKRQKAMNAAAITPYSGEVGAKEMGYGMDEKTKTVAMSTSTGKLSSEVVYVPRTENLRVDSLARIARKQPSFVVQMDAELPIWFTESS
ncbi:unnamed protein product [Brassica oleracea var. botrytis]|uniref:Uncharacterized protein n=1 Tax=Brassica oleracea TaxID=3712 RepID=A0A3P6F8M7_BRAOL|nr:unnamed protein product [Brassica oleracea]